MALQRTLLIPLSGFLGAGKTTLMLAAAAMLRDRGLTVACVTNDQGDHLVDSSLVDSKKVPLGQVSGGCFCCRFNELTDTLNVLIAAHRPDVILSEAVGSCTDLTATVILPLRAMHGDALLVKPLTTVIDPNRLEEAMQEASMTLSPEVGYIFRKQLEEASCLLLNKTDLLTPARTDDLTRMLRFEFPAARVGTASAAAGIGVAAWLDYMLSEEASAEAALSLDIDYDVYAEGEAQLGWLNASFTWQGGIADATGLCQSLMDRLAAGFASADAEIAHLKLWAQDSRHQLKISRVRNADAARVDEAPCDPWSTDRVTVWLNARIQMDDTQLKEYFTMTLEQLSSDLHLASSLHELECFAPARPVPTYRIGGAR